MADLSTNSVRQYFHSLNPMAKRICQDLELTRDSYESVWHDLSRDEQNQLMNETIILPEAVIKYHLGAEPPPSTDTVVPTFPVLLLDFGSKVLRDDSGAVWRDEHSAPFTWSPPEACDQRTSEKNVKETRKKIKVGSPPPPPPLAQPKEESIVEHPLPEHIPIAHQEDVVFQPEVPNDAWQAPKDEESIDSQSGLVKTGFDFLDNW